MCVTEKLITLFFACDPEGAVSRDLRDYVITERWGVLEQPLPGDTFILNLYRAWGTKCATNEVRYRGLYTTLVPFLFVTPIQ